jgi:GT2 family glycosyltransferase/glycosyltransferase involved in cell wall biosynthesis
MDSPLVATGLANTCRLTGSEFIKRGHDVYTVAFNSGQQPDGVGDWYGIKVLPNYALERDRNAIYGDAETILRIKREIDPDIYFFHNDSYRFSYIPSLPDGILEKSVFWLPFEGKERDHGGLDSFKKVAAVRFVTEYAKRMHEKELEGCDIGVIPHAIDHVTFCPCQDKNEAKAIRNLEGKFVITRVDRHQPRKYWDRAIRAFAKFAKRKDDVFFLAKCHPRDISMFDDGTKTGVDLEKLAVELGVGEKIKFDDYFFNSESLRSAFYDPADIMLTTTSGEGFGLGVAEAMACGLPIICPNVPVLPEIVGSNGMFCRISGTEMSKMSVSMDLVDIDDVADKLESAYSLWKEARLSGGPNRESIVKRFDPAAIYDEWISVLESVSDKRNLVSVITVMYNTSTEQIYGDDGIDVFKKSLQKNVSHQFEWIIVDNGSPLFAETGEWLAKASRDFEKIIPVKSDKNLGFAGGCNLGISRAKGKYVILANPDCEALDHHELGLPKDFVGMMLDKMRSNKRIGIVGMELKRRDDVLKGSLFPYFCNVLISKECLNACAGPDGQYLDEDFWPAYYEDCDFSMRAMGKGFKIVQENVPFWHKSGGTNKFAIDGGKDGNVAKALTAELRKKDTSNPTISRKLVEVATGGMQGMISGNIGRLNSKYGIARRSGIKVVWHTNIGAAVGFSQIAEGLIPELHALGFDVYINDWNNGGNVENPLIRTLIDKTTAAKEEGIDLGNAVNIVCWLMEAFLDVEADYKVGVSFCESTKIRPQYLQCCNSMDRILTFSDFCRDVQKDSGFSSPINVIKPGINKKFAAYYQRPKRGKFTFLSVGVSQERKDTRRLVDAFAEAFPKDAVRPPECEDGFPVKCNDIELVLKSNVFGDLNWVHSEGFSRRANIRTIFTGNHPAAQRPDMTTQEMYDLYCSVDCLVHPSHGEGIGMPLLEAAGTGLPIIFTNWSSPSEYLDDSISYPCSLSPYSGTTFTEAYPGSGTPGENGKWANINIGHMKHLMYHVVRNRDESLLKGHLASRKIAEEFSWEESARLLMPLLFEWDEERKRKTSREEFDPSTFIRPPLKKVVPGDRVMIDIVTRDRHSYLCSLLTSLLDQTFKDWDVIIQCDDSDDMMPNDFQIMSTMERLTNEGHSWRIIRSHRQGPHVAHDRTLNMTKDDPYGYKLICRIDDDIVIRPDFLEKLYSVYLSDDKCELAAVSGVYPDPRRSLREQTAPSGYESDINYAGRIDHNVPWPYVCVYPEGAKCREMEHLYSSFMYRTEAAIAVGGYCKLYSQIGHREESDFSYRLYLGGWKLLVNPEAIGFHYAAPNGGIRSQSIIDKEALANSDHKIYLRRLAKWKLSKSKKTDFAPRLLAVINAGSDPATALRSVSDALRMTQDVYVTTPSEEVRTTVCKLAKMVAQEADEFAILSSAIAADKDHDFIMTITDTMRFSSDPISELSPKYDNYVFETYSTYTSAKSARSKSGALMSIQDDKPVVGPELKNACLIHRIGSESKDIARTLYSNIRVIDDLRLASVSGKSAFGNGLIPIAEMDRIKWTKICIHQFPNGDLKEFKKADFIPRAGPLVSIVIPTAGRKQLLVKCINSIFTFTTTPFEIVVVDNGSSDGTAEWLAEESKKRSNIRNLRQSSNLGYQRAVNIGVAASFGEYILLFNDDAWIEAPEPDGRDWLRHCIDALVDNVGIVGPHLGKSPALGGELLYFWCVMMKKRVMAEVGPLDDCLFFNYGGDDDYCYRLREKGYSIKTENLRLRHLMNLVPEDRKRPELAKSEEVLKEKWLNKHKE